MDLDEARQFVRRNHHAVLATRTPDGGVQQSPVLVGVDAEGRFVVSSRETAFKTRNLRHDPWAQLCVLNDRFFGPWILVEGSAEVVPLPDAMEPLVDYYRALSGEHEDWDEYREAMRRDRRVLIRVSATRVGPERRG
jgi:PPOX class probable F420-dependent enzyme